MRLQRCLLTSITPCFHFLILHNSDFSHFRFWRSWILRWINSLTCAFSRVVIIVKAFEVFDNWKHLTHIFIYRMERSKTPSLKLNVHLIFCMHHMCAAGIGGLTALKLIRQHGSIENILENVNKERFFLILISENHRFRYMHFISLCALQCFYC